MGRPKLKPDERLSERIQARLTPEELAEALKVAGEQGVSAWVRELILAALKRARRGGK